MGVKVNGAAGPLALGAKGSVRDRLTPPGRVEGSALGRYIESLRWRGGRPQGRHTFPAERCYIPPEGGALNPPVRRSRSQAEPWQLRAERPGGWLNPHARKGVSTFGNTAPRRFLTKVHDFRRRRCPIAIPPLPPIWCIIKKNSLSCRNSEEQDRGCFSLPKK